MYQDFLELANALVIVLPIMIHLQRRPLPRFEDFTEDAMYAMFVEKFGHAIMSQVADYQMYGMQRGLNADIENNINTAVGWLYLLMSMYWNQCRRCHVFLILKTRRLSFADWNTWLVISAVQCAYFYFLAQVYFCWLLLEVPSVMVFVVVLPTDTRSTKQCEN